MGRMPTATGTGPKPPSPFVPFLGAFLCLFLVLAALFHESFEQNKVAFSNDGPLGAQIGEQVAMPAAFTGIWLSSFWIGTPGGQFSIDATAMMSWLLGPIGFSKYYEPLSMLLMGLCAWAFFRILGLNYALCLVAALAAALNGNYLSNACWGLGSRALTLGATFLAQAALNLKQRGNPWLNAALAGLAVGLGVIEGADNGIILSVYVAAFVVYQSFVDGGSLATGIRKASRLVLVTGLALFIATEALIGLMGFIRHDAETPAENPADAAAKATSDWYFATQWSLPPAETLRVLVPGLFGYCMNSPEGANYWGRVGEFPGAPAWKGGRFNGSGEYAGLLVTLLAIWAVAASFSKAQTVFSAAERKYIWFWAAMALVSVLLAWGRFAPFFRLVYSLPVFSSIRNPMKYMHPFHLALLVLFGYGLLGVSRRYLEKAARPLSLGAQLKSWWAKAGAFERKWTWGMAVSIGLSVVALLMYGSSLPNLEKFIAVTDPNIATIAPAVARFSVGEVGRYVGWLVASSAAMILVMSGVFSGTRARWGALLLGVVLTADLARAGAPWIVHWDYPYKYATNPVLDVLREKPYEARVTAPEVLRKGPDGKDFEPFNNLYRIEWNQQHFPYYNIQCLDQIQNPRPLSDETKYLKAIGGAAGRYWQLTNTRYVLGLTSYLDALNAQLDPGKGRFRVAMTFNVGLKPGVVTQSPTLLDLTAVPMTNGPLALFEFTAALPRTKLFSNWEVSTNVTDTLKKLADPAFDPLATVLVTEAIPTSSATTNHSASTAQIVSFKPKRYEIHAHAAEPSVLLLNDRFHPDWHVTVDGQPAQALHCNFIMRGVQVPAGDHTVIFTYETPLTGMKVTLSAYAVGFVLLGMLLLGPTKGAPPATPEPTPTNKPAENPRRKEQA